MPMPCTTALVKSLAVKAAAAGITPAIAVVMNRARVVAGLASHTNLRTRGKADEVPATDCLKFSHLPRRSLGPSGTGGSSGSASPLRPLLAGAQLGRFPPPPPPGPIGGGLPPPPPPPPHSAFSPPVGTTLSRSPFAVLRAVAQ